MRVAKFITILLIALFVVGCGSPPQPVVNPPQQVQPNLPPIIADLHVEVGAAVGISLGVLNISIDNNGTIKVAIVAATPRIPTPLGGFSVFVEGWAAFPERKTLTIATANESWIYDLNGEPFKVELHNVNAAISGENGNILVQVEDARANLRAEPRFETLSTNATVVMSASSGVAVNEYEIGRSANNKPIMVTRIGNGARPVVLVGGFHAGFAPGTVDLAERMLRHFTSNGQEVPQNVSLYIITVANPDSVGRGVESKNGRLNGNNVDINRNWDCNWTTNARWRDQPIGAGGAPFSEPEAQALRDFFLDLRPRAVVFWEARGELVIPGRCGPYRAESQSLASLYGGASGYKFGFITGYTVNGDVADWLDQQGIPAISILLSSYTATDWSHNLEGTRAVLQDVAR